MAIATAVMTATNDAPNAVRLKLAEPRVGLLDLGLGLTRDAHAIGRAETLDRIDKVLGWEWILCQLFQDIDCKAESDDQPADDCNAVKALFRCLQDHVAYIAKRP